MKVPLPKLRCQKCPGNWNDVAFVDLRIDGKVMRVILGEWGSTDAQELYRWLIGKYVGRGCNAMPPLY